MDKNMHPFDLEVVKKQARESLSQGAVTKDYPLDLRVACQLLNAALASEIMCVLRYRHDQFVAKGIDCPNVASEFSEHAEEEGRHMLMIAERINQLGGKPDFSLQSVLKNSATDYSIKDGLLEMIQDNLVAERIAIEVYRKLILWFGTADSTTRRMLEDILEDEEAHASDLADLLVVDDNGNERLFGGITVDTSTH